MSEAQGLLGVSLATWLTDVRASVNGTSVSVGRRGDLIEIALPEGRSNELYLTLSGRVPALPEPERRTPFAGAVAGAEGGFVPSYADWLPVADGGPIRYALAVEVPSPFSVVATGALTEEDRGNAHYRARFVSDHPSEPPSIFFGPFEIAERRTDGLRLRTYFHADLQPLAADYLTAAQGYIERFARQIGDYPFADFHIISAPLPIGLGFPNLTYVGRRVLPLPYMRGRSLAHEVLHNWWGNGVGIDADQGNWAEGLTTYLADHAVARETDAVAARDMRLGWLRNFAALSPAADMPVAGFRAKRHDAGQVVGYDKVAFIFHMLSREIGAAAFGAGLRRVWRDHRFGVAGWSTLQSAFEDASNRDLTVFFDQWLTRLGAPRVELIRADRHERAGAHRVNITLRQAEPGYQIRLPVVIETAAGAERNEAVLTEREQTFAYEVGYRPRAVHVDPEFDAFRRLLPGESPPILRDVTLSSETLVMVAGGDAAMARAADQLARRLLGRAPTYADADPASSPNVPLLVIGDAQRIRQMRAGLVTSAVAGGIVTAGTARAWTEHRPGHIPWLFVTADNAAALDAVVRPLPHYRSRSYVIFDGSTAIDKGVWPTTDSPLSYDFDD